MERTGLRRGPSDDMNLPNKLTIARLVLTLFFVASLSVDWEWSASVGLVVFLAAAITDYFDGAIARRHNLITNFGKLMDPLVDKILVAAALILLVERGLLWAWTVVAVVGREFLVTGLRLLAASDGTVVSADTLGKWKTTVQMVTVIFLLTFLAAREPAFSWLNSAVFDRPGLSPAGLGKVLELTMLGLTLISGLDYLAKNRQLLADS